ncbi:MAG: LysM peptidoglycan-binding domain-containing protein [Lawsonella sp.]
MATLPSELGTVSVQSGDTLSSIAGKVAPTADRTAMIERIQELNKLSSAVVYPGQLLVVPMG